MAPSYNFPEGPTNETDSQIFADIADINSGGLACTAYGVHATLFFLCLNALWEERKRTRRTVWPWITFITILFAIGTINDGVAMFLNQDAFVNHRNYPGGPGQFESDQFALAYNAMGNVVTIVSLWMTDALLIYRFYRILMPRWWWLSLPCLVYLASVVSSILLLHEVVKPGGTLWVPESVNLALIFWSLSIANNVLLTLSIAGYLLYMRLQIGRILGPNQAAPYITVSAILIESAFLYTAFGLAFLIPLAVDSQVNLIFIQVLPQVQSIAPLLIVLRVAQGRSLSKETLEGTMRETETAGPIQFRTTKTTQASSATAFQFSNHQGSFVGDGREKETSGSAIFQSKEAVNHEELLEMSNLTR